MGMDTKRLQSREWSPLPLDFLLSKYGLGNVKMLVLLFAWIAVITGSIISAIWISPTEFLLIGSEGSAELWFFLFYPPLIMGTLLLFWFGFEWGFIPLFLSTFVISYAVGITYYWGLLLGIAFVLGLGIYGLTYYCVPFDPGLRDLRSFCFYAIISFFAAMASSLGSFVWSEFFSLGVDKTLLLWQGWWTGMFLQSMLIVGPLLYLFTPVVYRVRDKYLQKAPKPKVTLNWIYSAIGSVAIVLLLFIIGANSLGTQAMTSHLELASLNKGISSDLFQTTQSYQIITWISIGLILAMGSGGIYLVNSWNSMLQEQVTAKTKQLKESNEKLEEALSERDLFLDSIHGQIRSNLSMIMATLEMQLKNDVDKSMSEILKDSHSRISCIALIHEAVDQYGSLLSLNIKKYAVKLSNSLQRRYKNDDQNIDVSLNVGDLNLGIDYSVSLAMIMNELIANALIHGFKNKKTGVIMVDLVERSNGIVLRVRNNGSSLDNNFDPYGHKTLGFKLIRTLAKKLYADFTIEDHKNPTFQLIIPIHEMDIYEGKEPGTGNDKQMIEA